MSISQEEVKKIAKLSRIRLTEGQVKHFQQELSNILEWAKTLQEVNTDNVPKMTSVSNIRLPLRKDEVTDGNKQQEVLQNAPKSEFGCYIVPKVVE